MIMAAVLAVLSGADDPVIDVNAGSYTAQVGVGGSYTLESDGDVLVNSGLGLAQDIGDWIDPKDEAPGAYEVRATLNSGSLNSGTTGSWLALTSTRTWTCSSTLEANLTVEIRDGAGDVQDSGTVIIVGGDT